MSVFSIINSFISASKSKLGRFNSPFEISEEQKTLVDQTLDEYIKSNDINKIRIAVATQSGNDLFFTHKRGHNRDEEIHKISFDTPAHALYAKVMVPYESHATKFVKDQIRRIGILGVMSERNETWSFEK
jgi:fructose 1,6-bisphosphatase